MDDGGDSNRLRLRLRLHLHHLHLHLLLLHLHLLLLHYLPLLRLCHRHGFYSFHNDYLLLWDLLRVHLLVCRNRVHPKHRAHEMDRISTVWMYCKIC